MIFAKVYQLFVCLIFYGLIRLSLISKKTNLMYFLYFFILIINSIFILPNYIWEMKENNSSNYWIPFLILNIILTLILIRMLYFEILEWRDNKKTYFKSLWNILDNLNIIFSFSCIMLNYCFVGDLTQNSDVLRLMHSIWFFFAMIRIFDFFRAFKSTCFMIEIVIKVVYDMKTFLFLMCLFVSTFSCSGMQIYFN